MSMPKAEEEPSLPPLAEPLLQFLQVRLVSAICQMAIQILHYFLTSERYWRMLPAGPFCTASLSTYLNSSRRRPVFSDGPV